MEFSHICKYYQMGETKVKAADDVSFKIDEGEFVAIVGPSGSGKSTCMNIMGCLDVPTSGSYTLFGETVGALGADHLAELRGRAIGFVFQHYNLLGKLTAGENVELPMFYLGVKEEQRRKRAKECLCRVGLGEKENNFPSQLSGGEQQRVSIARALANSPKLILADEPTGALDSKTGLEIIELLSSLVDEGSTVVQITHNRELARMSRRIITLSDGKVVSDEKLPSYGRR